MMHLKAITLQIFREKGLFGLATNLKRRCIRKLILVNLGTPGEASISKLLTAFFIFIGLPPFGQLVRRPCVIKYLKET